MGKTRTSLSILLLLVFCCLPASVVAQDAGNEIKLVRLLDQLQNRYDLEFNYALDNVENISLEAPSPDLTIEELLGYLKQNTGLEFILVSNEVVLVKKAADVILCGFIKNKDNLQPLSEATIQSGTNSTVSDSNGFFQIEVSSATRQIIIRHLGFKSMIRNIDNFDLNACSELFLVPFFEELEEVFISNYIVPGIDKLNSGDFSIDLSQFEILPGLIDADVLQSIQSFPGIMSVNETVSNINIRGGTHDQNLILWDGIKMYQSGHFFGLISMYNPQITDKVLLTKNGTDAGLTDGVSGSISMFTDDKINTQFNANVGLDLIDLNAFIDLPVGEKSSVQLAARKSISDFIETPTYDRFFDRISQDTEVSINQTNVVNSDKAFDFYDTAFRWLYRPSDNDEIRLNFILVSNELEFDERAITAQQEESRRSSLSQNSIAGGLGYTRTWNDAWKTTFELFETDYKLKAINVNVLESQRFLQENKVSETSAKLFTSYKINPNLRIKAGYHFVETEVTNLDDVDVPLFRLLVSEVVRTHAGFVQVALSSGNGLTNLKLGGRYTFIDKFRKSIVEPRLSLSQRFLNDFTLEISGEMKHQNTSQVINFQNDFLGIEKRRWQLADNDQIPVIQSKQISAGVAYENQGWLINAEGYYKQVDGITTQSQGFQNQYEFIRSSGSFEVYGLDVLLRKNIKNVNAWVSYSNMNNNYTFAELEPTPFRSNYDITHSLTSGIAVKIKNINISTGINWHSGKPASRPVPGNEVVDGDVNFGPTNQQDLDDYVRLDASAMYRFKMGGRTKARIGLSVWNLLNKENTIDNFYRIQNETLNETVQRSLGITPNAVFQIYF
ncbi:MAG: TonB-dependent receptor [Flavobacteriaceae bacterium]|nr:TonB-dependent receptor [Flavobacteriaceae bacterium]